MAVSDLNLLPLGTILSVEPERFLLAQPSAPTWVQNSAVFRVGSSVILICNRDGIDRYLA